jgi:type III secretory pathway component EscT
VRVEGMARILPLLARRLGRRAARAAVLAAGMLILPALSPSVVPKAG